MRPKPRVEMVEWNGETWRRWPDSEHRSDAVYFKSKNRWLHREVWKAAHGRIPKHHHVHHRDGNPSNNALENLECVPRSEHLREHMLTDERRAISRTNLTKARVAASAWHKSPEGRAWHSRMSKAAAKKRPKVACICEQCGAVFYSKRAEARICSVRCY